MTPRPGFRDFGADRDDPTGMRSLLSSLPDPAPMPDDVAARIGASLAEAAGEQRHRPPLAQRGGPPWEKARAGGRAASRTIGALAAGFLVIAGAGVFGLHTLQSGRSSAPPMVVAPPATRPGPSQVTPPASPSSPTVPGRRSGAPTPLFTATKTVYSSASLEKQAAMLWTAAGAAHPSFTLPSLAAEQPGIGPLATPLGLSDCIRALGLEVPDRVVVDFARYAGRPAAVLVTANGPALQVHVVERTCRAGRPGVIAGPLAVAVPAR